MGRTCMFNRSLIAAIAIVVALCATTAEIRAWDDSKYPDLKGQWVRAPGGGPRAGSPAHTRISGHLRGDPGGSGRGRSGGRSDLSLSFARHAAHHARLC